MRKPEVEAHGLRKAFGKVQALDDLSLAAVPVVFLLVFTSAAFVPATAMPGWLQGVRYPSATRRPGQRRMGADPRRPGSA